MQGQDVVGTAPAAAEPLWGQPRAVPGSSVMLLVRGHQPHAEAKLAKGVLGWVLVQVGESWGGARRAETALRDAKQ